MWQSMFNTPTILNNTSNVEKYEKVKIHSISPGGLDYIVSNPSVSENLYRGDEIVCGHHKKLIFLSAEYAK